MKDRQEALNAKYKEEKLNKISMASTVAQPIKLIVKQQFDSHFFSKRLIDDIRKIYEKHHFLMKDGFERQIEDMEIRNIVQNIKANLAQSVFKDQSLYGDKQNIIKFLNEHKNQTQYYEEIIRLRTRIDEINKVIEKLVSEEAIIFKDKYNRVKKSEETAVKNDYYESVYNALFGIQLVF